MKEKIKKEKEITRLKGAFSGLRQFLETKSLLKMLKIAFHFTLTALVQLLFSRYLRFCLEKQLD